MMANLLPFLSRSSHIQAPAGHQAFPSRGAGNRVQRAAVVCRWIEGVLVASCSEPSRCGSPAPRENSSRSPVMLYSIPPTAIPSWLVVTIGFEKSRQASQVAAFPLSSAHGYLFHCFQTPVLWLPVPLTFLLPHPQVCAHAQSCSGR